MGKWKRRCRAAWGANDTMTRVAANRDRWARAWKAAAKEERHWARTYERLWLQAEDRLEAVRKALVAPPESAGPEDERAFCCDCGREMEQVRPGKWQCNCRDSGALLREFTGAVIRDEALKIDARIRGR